MSSKYMLISHFSFNSDAGLSFAVLLKKKESNLKNISYYISQDNNELIEFIGYDSLDKLFQDELSITKRFTELKDYLSGDIKRELLTYVGSPIVSDTVVPKTKYIQLRHVEILPSAYEAYLKWREKTIYKVVTDNANLIRSFDAYHSFISGVPGVMFISAFSGEIEEYLEPFTNENYKKIITEAGDNYICTGKDGLYTKIYKKFLTQ